MTTRYAMAALVAAMLAGGPAFAQSVPEGQSCGGLLCDMGVFGHKTEPKPPAPSPAPVHAEAAPPTVAAEPADLKPKPKAVRKKKRVAKAAALKEKVLDKAKDNAKDTTMSEAKAVPTPAANVAKRPASVVQAPVPFGWQTAVTQPSVAPTEPPAAPTEPPPAPAKTPVAQAKPQQPAGASMPVNVINLYSSLPSTTNIRPLY